VVAGREPGGGRVGFAGDEDAVGGLHPPVVGAEDDGAVEGFGDAAVGDGHLEVAALGENALGRDVQFVAVPGELGASAVHFDSRDLQLLQVQVEGGERLGGAGGERRTAVEAVGVRVVRHVEGVVPGVEAAVAEVREVGVADARGARSGGGGGGDGKERGRRCREGP